jgi:hypothetical protein
VGKDERDNYREQRAESREKREESREQKAESREERAESREQRAKSKKRGRAILSPNMVPLKPSRKESTRGRPPASNICS